MNPCWDDDESPRTETVENVGSFYDDDLHLIVYQLVQEIGCVDNSKCAGFSRVP